MTKRGWQFWIDRGGTFTDVVARGPDNKLLVRKLLSENPDRYADAVVAGITEILAEYDTVGQDSAPEIDAIKMGTTAATNALLERRGEPTVLAITEGFRDALKIGYQNRPEIFALGISLPKQLYGAVLEVTERVAANGSVLVSLDTASLEAELRAFHAEGYRSIAICFMHAHLSPAHELTAGALAKRIGFGQVSLSHEVSPLQKLVSRGDTAVVDAYLSPVLAGYVERLRAALDQVSLTPTRLMFMQSNGGLTDENHFRGKDSVLSGPAGGVVGMVSTSQATAGNCLIGFDMGGTSTDVSLFSGDFEFVNYTEIAGVRIRSPMIRIHTVAAGGGSILKFDSGRFQVGPDSAGADPGPTCYRRGGPLTVTDANLILGKILPEFFPRVFGTSGNKPLDRDAVLEGFSDLAKQINTATGKSMTQEAVAEGFIRIAVDNMASAIKRVSIQRGYDPSEFTLCCFGGASGQHACMVAEQLGINTILIHPLAGVLSAYGIGTASLGTYEQKTIEVALHASELEKLHTKIEKLAQKCRNTLLSQEATSDSITVRTTLNVKVTGSDTTLPVDWGDMDSMLRIFEDAHNRRFGFSFEGKALQVESLRVDALGTIDPIKSDQPAFTGQPVMVAANQQTRIFYLGKWHDAVVYHRGNLITGEIISGPAIIIDDTTTIIVESGWRLRIDVSGHVILDRVKPVAVERQLDEGVDPIMLEVFNSHFMNIAENMGTVLENTAHSVNIKERLDFSCALFDRAGNLIANAPHIPVHLGAMGDSVQAIIADNAGSIRAGNVYMLNSPYNGGSHLPDVTVVTPVIGDDERSILFLVACRAHHADIGGISPGSMPAGSKTIHEEGVLFDNFLLISGHQFREDELRTRLSTGPYPARNVEQNIADLRAQVAANERGVQELHAMVDHFGLAAVQAYMGHLQANAEESVRSVIDKLSAGEFCLEIDGGQIIQVRISVDAMRREALIDFTGTSPQSPGNFNAPIAVTRAAVLYVFRSLLAKNIPLNSGCLKPIQLKIPEACLLNPGYPAAVVAGNVETSQCVTNALYGALNVMAAAQGTMNNLTFGNDRYQYYETICGGAGAGETFAGADAVHTHMTNSRITDPEVLESRFPVLVREFAIRPNSGGAGQFRGGHGVVRKIEFRHPMQVAILSNNRRLSPFGLMGGEAGKPGLNYVVRHTGEREPLQAVDELKVETGDVLVIETPGGGGFGSVRFWT
jgi:5-oxoprolinase (ATP-hydrolysing)